MRGRSLWKGFQVSLYTWIRDLFKYFLYSTPHLLGSETVLSGLSKSQFIILLTDTTSGNCNYMYFLKYQGSSILIWSRLHFFDLAESRAIKMESFIRINRKKTQVLALKKG